MQVWKCITKAELYNGNTLHIQDDPSQWMASTFHTYPNLCSLDRSPISSCLRQRGGHSSLRTCPSQKWGCPDGRRLAWQWASLGHSWVLVSLCQAPERKGVKDYVGKIHVHTSCSQPLDGDAMQRNQLKTGTLPMPYIIPKEMELPFPLNFSYTKILKMK